MGKIFKSADDFMHVLDKHDRLIQACANELIPFDQFLRQYDNFYDSYALDGHESDETERSIFEKHKVRIAPHEKLARSILSKLCSDEDALKETYIDAGRFGTSEALRRIKVLNAKFFS